MLTVLHGADFHLDSPFSELSPEQAKLRRQEARQLLTRLQALAVEKQADLVLLAGDILDSGTVYRETLEAMETALGACPCPVLIAPGNHDPYTEHSPWAKLRLPDHVHIFRQNKPERVAFPSLGCVVYGAGFIGETQEESLLESFRAEDEGLLRLMVLHGDVTKGDSPYQPLRVEQIAATGLHYLALGHIHRTGGLQKAGETYWAYAGCPEGRGFDETGEKGVLLLRLDGKTVTAELVPLAQRHYQLLTVDITGQDALTAVQARLPQTAKQDACRIVLTGEREGAPLDLLRLEEALRPLCWQIQLRDETRAAQELWEKAGEDSLRGLALQALLQKRQTAQSGTEHSIDLAAQFLLAAMDGREL